MCSSTASSLKRAMPYCKYIILAEFLKLGNNATPEFTEISEIYVVCKAKNTERKKRKDQGLPPHIVHDDVAAVHGDGVLTLGFRVGVVVGGVPRGRQVVPVPRLLHTAVSVVVGELVGERWWR